MIIALLTDFGTKDYFIGAMKGSILTINPEAKIVDITHETEPQNIHSAGFTLANCFRDFPPKTIFIAIVDPGVGSNRRAILVETERYYFVTPDNGLASFILQDEKTFRVFELTNSRFFREPLSQTFHGRDIFAPVGAWLSKGVNPEEFGPKLTDVVRLELTHPRIISDNETEGEIIQIDHFGNLITNLKIEDLKENFVIEVNGYLVSKHQNYYSEVKPDEIFTIFGSAGFLEIVANQNSAENILQVTKGDKIIVKT